VTVWAAPPSTVTVNDKESAAAPVLFAAVTPVEPVTVPALVTALVATLESAPVVVEVNTRAPPATVATLAPS
jgi:hypothetical protein